MVLPTWVARALTFKPVDKKHTTCNSYSGKKLYSEIFDDDMPVIITKVVTNHGSLCKPLSNNLMNARCRGGTYMKGVSLHAIHSLCMTLKHEGRIRNWTIKSILKHNFTMNKNAKKHHVYYYRLKIKNYCLSLKIVTHTNFLKHYYNHECEVWFRQYCHNR